MEPLKKYIDSIISLSSKDWKVFSILFSEFSLPKDQYFAEVGKVETRLGFLTNGVIRAFYRSKDGNEFNKTFFEPYEFLAAYASLVTGQPNQIHLQALTHCKLLVADYNQIRKLYDSNPMIERIARIIAEFSYINKERREIEIVLLDAAERYEIFKKEYPTLENLIPQYHIASYLGITPTQLSRIRAKK